MKPISILLSGIALLCLQSCEKDNSSGVTPVSPNINFIFKFDSTQVRLNGAGVPTPVPAGHAAQSPRFNNMSAHYLELTSSPNTFPGAGAVLFKAPEVTTGGSLAIDFSRSRFAGPDQTFLTVPLSALAAGTYNYLRVSLAYQNYNVYINAAGTTIDATVAAFIGFNTYLSSYKIKDSTVNVNANKLQGYWAIEGKAPGFGFVTSGQAPPGATTVPNPLFASSPIPAGSCLVTGQFAAPLVITGTENKDINIIVSLSTNKSFQWISADGNTTYDPANGDQVVDMGIRGLVPSKQ